jgi:hypothetical protein
VNNANGFVEFADINAHDLTIDTGRGVDGFDLFVGDVGCRFW